MSEITDILALTDRVEALIADGEWAEAAELEQQRRDLLVRYVELKGSSASGLRELHERSVRSMDELTRTRRRLAGDASAAIGKSRAVDAYLDNSQMRDQR